MDMRNFKGRVLLGKLAARMDDAKGAAGYLDACLTWGDRAAEFEHNAAREAAGEKYRALRSAAKDFLESGGNRNSWDFIESVDTARWLGILMDRFDNLAHASGPQVEMKPEYELRQAA